jgi:hypothetical protein
MTIASHKVAAPSPEAFASLTRSLFPGAPGYSRNRIPPVGRDRRPLGVHAPSCEVLRWPLSLFLDRHGSVFTRGPSPLNPPKHYSVLKVLCISSFIGGEKWKDVPVHFYSSMA